MKHFDRVEIPPTVPVPAFSDTSRRYLGKVIGFYRNRVFIMLDEPVIVHDHPEKVVCVSASLPIPVSRRYVEGRGWIDMDVRHLCTSSACMNPSTTLMNFENGSALYCDVCSQVLKMSASFVSATPLDAIEEVTA